MTNAQKLALIVEVIDAFEAKCGAGTDAPGEAWAIFRRIYDIIGDNNDSLH